MGKMTDKKRLEFLENDRIKQLGKVVVGKINSYRELNEKIVETESEIETLQGNLKRMRNDLINQNQYFDDLRKKYSLPYYLKLLLSTGNRNLHELPLNGVPGKWSYKNGKGGDILGKMLMKLRVKLEEPTIMFPPRVFDSPPHDLSAIDFKVHLEIDLLKERVSGYTADCEEDSEGNNTVDGKEETVK